MHPTALTPTSAAPVLPAGAYALRPLGMPWWTIANFRQPGADSWSCDFTGAYVTDDFGGCTQITGASYLAAEHYWLSHRRGQEEAAAEFEHAAELARQREERGAFEAANTRALLRPEPIVVEIGEPCAEHGDVEVRVGPDARVPGVRGPALYRVAITGNEPVWITHAQLAALGVAAEHLCRSARGRRAH